MDQLRALRRRARGEVVALDERGAQAPGGGVEGHAGAGDAAADHEHVERARRAELLAASPARRKPSSGHRRHPTELSISSETDRAPGPIGHRRAARRSPDDPYDPDPYLDEADVRDELTRVFDVCHGCRRCVDLCAVVPDAVRADRPPRRPGRRPADPGRAGPGRRRVLPVQAAATSTARTSPGRDERAIDFPRLMLRAEAMRHATGQVARARPRRPTRCWGAPTCVGRLATRRRRWPTGVVGAKPGSRRAQGGRAGHRRVQRAPAAAVRPAALHDVVHAAARRCASPSAQGSRGRVPDVPRRVPEPGDRPRPRQGLRAQRDRVLAGRRRGAAAARRGCTAATSSASPRSHGERRGARRRGPRRAATSSCPSRRAATC